MDAVFLKLVNMSITAGWLVLAVLVLRLLLKKAPKAIHCLLWALVAIRLVLPISFESVLSLIPSTDTLPEQMLSGSAISIHTGVELLDRPINAYLDDHTDLNAPSSVTPLPPVDDTTVVSLPMIVWIVGMIGMTAYAVISYGRLRRRVRESVAVQERVRICDHIDIPFILGLFRPRIYLPSAIDENDRTYVLAHEHAHLKRRDHWWKPFGFALLTVYWFNPLLWVAYILLCRDIELACDEKVLRDMGIEHKKQYSQALLTHSVSRRSIAACPLAFGEVAVKERIKSVLHYKKPAFWITSVATIACIAVAACFLTDPKTESTDNTPPATPLSNQQILNMIDEIVDSSSVSLSSNPYDYISAKQDVFDAIIAYGEDAVTCFVSEIRQSQGNSLREYIMAAACAEITGIGLKQGEYDPATWWSTAHEWLALYDRQQGLTPPTAVPVEYQFAAFESVFADGAYTFASTPIGSPLFALRNGMQLLQADENGQWVVVGTMTEVVLEDDPEISRIVNTSPWPDTLSIDTVRSTLRTARLVTVTTDMATEWYLLLEQTDGGWYLVYRSQDPDVVQRAVYRLEVVDHSGIVYPTYNVYTYARNGDAMFNPQLSLSKQDDRCLYSSSMLSSYVWFGRYTRTKDTVTLYDDSGALQYVFAVQNGNLVWDADRSQTLPANVPDGAVFVPTPQ